MANKKFGETLRKLRNTKGYTQQQVADILGLKNKSTLGSWEVGKSEPDGYTLLKLCKIYEVEDIYSAFDETSTSSTHINNVTKSNLRPLPSNSEIIIMKNNNEVSQSNEILDELYEVVQTLSEKEQLYLLDTVKSLKKLLNEKDKNTL